ncbi:MAG: pseudouridine synthase [Candidatus Eremiobacterota bacterium]
MIRLNRFLAHCGISSRREAENLIETGRIKVNDRPVTKQGVKIDPDRDRISFDGVVINSEEKVYLIINKPKGYVTTSFDPQKRPTVLDLLPDMEARVYPVGRLDYNTEGLLILTNDGDFSFRLIHPKYKIGKVYIVKLYGGFSPKKLEKLRNGVELSDGLTAPARVKLVKAKGKETIFEMEIYEGKKRQIRRMCTSLGYRVVELRRVQIGTLRLGSLKPGAWRYLGPNEVRKLKELVGLEEVKNEINKIKK